MNQTQSWIFVTPDPLQALPEMAQHFHRTLESDPNIIVLQPEEGETSIKIEQVRHLQQALTMHILGGGERLVLIAPAETISLAGQQALLKLLEEPPAKTVLALVARPAASLPDTIRSRCTIQWKVRPSRGEGLLAQLSLAPSLAAQIKLAATLPIEREALKQLLLQELSLPVPVTKRGITLKSRALEAYEALQVNVTTQWAINHLLFHESVS